MNFQKLLFIPLIALIAMSFTSDSNNSANVLKMGTYGVCSCNSAELNFRIELTFLEDNTFSYFDNSDPKRIIDITGNWTIDKNTVLLKDFKSDFPIHDKWLVDDNGLCLKSRKGLEFERICNVSACEN